MSRLWRTDTWMNTRTVESRAVFSLSWIRKIQLTWIYLKDEICREPNIWDFAGATYELTDVTSGKHAFSKYFFICCTVSDGMFWSTVGIQFCKWKSRFHSMQISVQMQLAKEQMGFHCSTAYQATPPIAFLICIFLKCNRKAYLQKKSAIFRLIELFESWVFSGVIHAYRDDLNVVRILGMNDI